MVGNFTPIKTTAKKYNGKNIDCVIHDVVKKSYKVKKDFKNGRLFYGFERKR